VSILISAGIHVALVFFAAAVVWHTVTPGAGDGGAKISFENVGDAPVPNANSATANAVASAAAVNAGAPVSPGFLAPMMNMPEVDVPLLGLATSPPASIAAPSGLGSLGGALSSGSMVGGGAGSGVASGGAAAGQASVTFGGLGAAKVSSVVYVVDCSGPMVTSLPIVLAELERSVGKLTPSQKFGVILFRRIGDEKAGGESFAPTLVRGTPSAKQLLHDWLVSVEPAGRSSPLTGLELALAMKPDAIFLLSRAIQRSDGNVWEAGLDATMSKLEQLNPMQQGLTGARRPVLIQTIQFLDEDPTGIMQAIGQRHGGGNGYRVVKKQQDLMSPEAARQGRIGDRTSVGVPDR
jgi:hypothetical protein